MNTPLDFNHREADLCQLHQARIDTALVADSATRSERDYLGGRRLGDACAGACNTST